MSNSVIRRVGPEDSVSFEGTTGVSKDGPIAVEKVRVTGSCFVDSGIVEGGGGRGSLIDCVSAVAVSVRIGPASGFESDSVVFGLDVELFCASADLASIWLISTGVGAGNPSSGCEDCWGIACGAERVSADVSGLEEEDAIADRFAVAVDGRTVQ